MWWARHCQASYPVPVTGLVVEIMWEAAVQKLLSFFSTKNISVFGYKVVKHLTSWPLNKLVKLTVLWTTRPRATGEQQIRIMKHIFFVLNSLTTKKQTTKFSSANFPKMISPSYIMLTIQILEGKQCRSRWDGSLWATSSRSRLFAKSAILSLLLKS